MGCACTKRGEVSMIGYKNPATVLLGTTSSNVLSTVSHVRVTTLTVQQQPDVYLGALEQKLHVRRITYRPHDYRAMLQELRTLFFQYLDQRTILQDDRGRPVSARYRKAMDWKLYEKFEREFAAELYRRRHESITRQELTDLFEAYLQSTHVNLRPEHLKTDGHDDRQEYIGRILIIPSHGHSTSTTNNTQVGIYVNHSSDEDSSSSSSDHESSSSKTKDTTQYVKASFVPGRSRSNSRSSSSSGSESGSGDDREQGSRKIEVSEYNGIAPHKDVPGTSESSSSSGTESSSDNVPEPFIDYEAKLEEEFQRISAQGISADEYILLLLLYTQALEELRNQPQGQGRQDIINNLENSFETKRKIITDKIEEARRKREEESRVPDTKGYSEVVEKELKDNEAKLARNILVGTDVSTDSKGTGTGPDDRSQYEKQLQDFINQQTALIQKLEAEREEEIKQLEAEIAATQTTGIQSESTGVGTEKTEDQIIKDEKKQIEKRVKKIYKKLENAIMEDPSNKKNIKKKLKKARKKLKNSMEELDGERLKRHGLTAKDKGEITEVIDESIGHVEDTKDYGEMADRELLKEEDFLFNHIKRMRELSTQDLEGFEKEKQSIGVCFDNQSRLMLQIEEERKELIDKTEKNLRDRQLIEMNRKCKKDVLKDVTDDERIKQILEKHRHDHKHLATELDADRIRQRTFLKQRLKNLRRKQGRSGEVESESNMFDLIRATDDYSEDIDKELKQETDTILAALKQINSYDSDGKERRRILLEEYLDQLDNTFKRLDSDRHDIVKDIELNLSADAELIDDMNTEIVQSLVEDISSHDDDMVKRKIQEHRMRQKKLLEDMDSDRLQKRSLLARKLLQRKNKPAVDEQVQAAAVMDTDEYCEAIDKELKCDEDELIDYLTKDVTKLDDDSRQQAISDRLGEHVGRQKEAIGRLESERRERIIEATKEPTIDVPSNLNSINSWLKRSLSNGPISGKADVKDKLEEFRKRQRKLLEDVDSTRLQHRKKLQEKLQKLREEKELNGPEDSIIDTDGLVNDIATMAGTNEDMTEEDKEFVKEIYKQKEQNTLSDDEIQKRLSEHFSRKRKMKDLIDEENKSSRNKILERKESLKKKRAEEEEQKNRQEADDQRTQEENEEEQRKALSRAYRNNPMVKSSSLIRKHQADQARMAIVVEEGKSKVKDKIKEKKRRKHQQQNGYGEDMKTEDIS